MLFFVHFCLRVLCFRWLVCSVVAVFALVGFEAIPSLCFPRFWAALMLVIIVSLACLWCFFARWLGGVFSYLVIDWRVGWLVFLVLLFVG